MDQKELVAQLDYDTPLQLSQTLSGTMQGTIEAQSNVAVASPQLEVDSQESKPLSEQALVDVAIVVQDAQDSGNIEAVIVPV